MAAFGVYFGCSSACIAVCRDGRTDVIANDLGDRVTPAVVAFTDHDEAVGLAAKQGIYRNPVNTICNVKRLLGRAFDDEDVQTAVESGPVKITDVDKKPVYQVTYKERSCTFSPVKIATIIYKKMMETAESSEGLADSHDAVLAVPYNFDESQQQAVRDAATKAGFNVLRIITEPAAALLAYNIGQMDVTDNCLVLVFRVGHQSLDLTLVQVISGMYHVLASHSDPKVGGHLIDDYVVEYFANEFQRQMRSDCRGNKRSLGKLQAAVDSCKHVLSTVQTSQCSVESLYDGIDFSCTLSRSRFEALCSNFIQKCLSPLDEFLSSANLSRASINKVIMCGGCAKIPLLQQQVMEYFKDAEMLASIAPDEVIAVGAAIQAGILCGRDNGQVIDFSSACELPCLPADVVILVGSGEDLTEFVLFSASTPMPARRQVTFSLCPQETSFCLHLIQRTSAAKTTLAKIVMRELPLGASVSGVFHIRHDGSLHAKCSESTSNQIQDVVVDIVHVQDRSTSES